MSYNSNQFRRGLPRRLSAMILTVCMVFTMAPPVTAAGVTDSGKILLSGFAELPENIREQSVPLGVSLDELTLPDTMTATVGVASVDAEPTPDTESEEPKDSGAATMPTEEQPTLGTSDEPASKAEIIEENDVPLAEEAPLAASPSDAQDEAVPDAEAGKTVIISGITWESDPLYDNETEGTYLFTAVLPSGYTVEDGVAMPVITVVVGQAEQSAVDKVIAMIDALPTMDEWTAMDETAARTVMNEILAAKKAYDALTAEEKAQIEVTSTAKLTELAGMAQQLANTMPMADDVRLEFKSDSPSVSGAGYEWVKDTKTLTLTGFDHTTNANVGIQLPDGATLVVNGTNSLTVTGGDAVAQSMSVKGNYGIFCGDEPLDMDSQTLYALTIEGSGTLSVTCAYTGAERLSYSWGMKAKSITMNGGTVTCTGDKAGESYGVLVEDAITINGGSLSGISGENTEFGSVSYGVCTETGNITVNSGGTLKGTGSTGMMMNNLTVDGGSVIGVGKGDDSQNMGVVANNDLTINSGTLTGTAEDCTDMSVGVGAQGTIAVNGGTVTATSGTSAMSIAVMAAAALTTGDGVIIKCNSAGNTGYADEANFALVGGGAPGMVYEGADQTTVATDVKIYKSALDFATEGSTTPHTGTGYVWVEGTKTLTLTNLNYTATDSVGIILPDGATLVVNGTNSLMVTGAQDISGNADHVGNDGILCGSYGSPYNTATLGALTIEGNGTLEISCAYTGSEYMKYSWGMRAKSITMNGGTVTCTGNKSGHTSYGVLVEDAITINGGSLSGIGGEATESSHGVHTENGNITVNSGKLTGTGGKSPVGSYGVYSVSGTFTVNSSGTLTGTGESSGSMSVGVAAKNLTVDGGSVVGVGGDVKAMSGGVAVSNTLAVNSGTLTGTSGTVEANGMSIAVMAAVALTPGDGVVIKCNSRGNTGYADEANFTTSNNLGMGLVFEGTDQTTIATDVKIYKLPSYAVTINVQKDNKAWSDHGKTFKLSKDGGSTFVPDLSKVADGTYTVYEGSTSTGVTVTVSGAAALATVEYYTVTFYDGGTAYSIPAPQVVLKTNGRVTKPADPSKTGYTFAGWKTADGGATAFDFTNTAITAATGVYASWTVNSYTVTLNGNGGTGAGLSSYTYGSGATLPTGWTKTGYTFEGWYDNAGLTGSAVTTISATDTGNKEYWAKWEVISVSGVSLDKTSATLVTGETEALTATVLPADAANKSVTWQSSNTSVATVANGTVTAVDAGTAVITVTTVDGSKTATCTVTVNKNDAQLVAAAKTKIVDGTVNVAFGATQADKTAAVQTYVDALLTGDAAGVTATVTHTSGGSYSVTISKGSVTDSKSITMTVNVAPDPDIATVAAAKTAAENATYTTTTQAATGTESAAQTYVQNIAKTAVNNSGVTVTVNKVSYTAPIAGTSADSDGTDGSYVFTVTVSKGAQNQTTTQKTLTITATAFTGVTDVAAVAAAKAAIVDGAVNVAFGATQADKTAAVQTYVEALLTGDAAGVTATVTHNSGTGKYDVALSKGSVTDSKSITMTVNVAPDPDIATVEAAKTAAENAIYTATTQAATGTESAANTYVQDIAKTAVNNSGVTVTVNKVSYTAPVVGTSADPDGTDGSYVFTVTVSKGAQNQTTVQKTLTITATAFIGVTDVEAVAAAKLAIIDGTVTVAFGATQADKTSAVQSYVNSKLTGDAAGVTAAVTYNSGTGKYDVNLSKGSVTDSKSITMTVNVAPDPDIATVEAAKTAAENATYTATTQGTTGTESAAQTYVKNIATTAVNNSGVTVTVNKVSYTAPVAGTPSDKDGTNGSYAFTITVSKGSQSETTVQKTLTITATPYTGVTDAEAVAAAKDAVVDGTVTVAFGATQADKTAAVQTYVNSKLTGDAAGVTATVTYNSSTGKYDVALSKGMVSDSKSITMTVNESADPDLATVTAAKTAAENATYAATTQGTTGTESAAQAYVQNIATTAVNNNGVTVTVNKVSYTAPVAGTSSDKDGINGSYVFTVTVSKGTQSQTTTQKTLTITATPYTGVTDAEAVAAAKDAVVDGTVTVPTGATQADKTAAVQSYVNDRLAAVPSAAGVTATVTYNSGTGKYDVTLSKGTVSDNKTITMTVTESADPDLATVTAAKTAAENATYTATTQGTTGTESATQTYVKNIATTAVNNSGVTVTVNKVSYTAPVAGTSSDRDGTNGSYIFTITVSKGSQRQTTTQITVVITATAYSGSTGGDGGGGGGGGGSTGGGTTTPPTSKPTEPVTGNTENKATVDDKGNANVSISDKNITDAIANAKAEADKKGVNAGEITAVINVTTGGKDATTVSVNLPKVVQEQVIGNKIAKVELVIDRPDLTIGMNLSAVTEINKQANADVQISASKTNAATLSADAKAAIGNRPAYDLKATYQSGGKSVTNFGAGTVSIEIPYKLQSGENAGNIYAVYVDGNGKVTYLTSSSYDAKRETLVFTTNHFSVYGVGFKATSSKFTDTADHWAKDSIDFVVSRGLMNGTSATTFSPNDAMTRGMFVTTLGRLSGVDVSGYKASSFSDVAADAYYMGYIEWANKNNIVVGIGGGKFAPDTLVTREQMAVIMDRYATAIGFKLPEVHAANTFADNTKIGGWSAESVKRIQMAGIITGKTGNVFDPQGTATRAEVSAVIKRFVELAAFSNTAQGWMMNDSGKWMYYENGKPVTGTKNIDGTTYTFNSYGEIADTPKKLTYGAYTVKKGDSWWKIAREQNCNMYELARVNGKTIFSFMYAGEVLKIPQQ